MITSRRSARASQACFASAMPRSACTLRSWNSSRMIVRKPASSGSCCSRAVRMPSVAKRTVVAGPNWRSKRTCHPTSLPIVHPCSAAMRAARLLAATRRGCRTITGPSTASAGGTRVVFPAPGAAVTTTARESRTLARISGRRGSIGRWAIAIGAILTRWSGSGLGAREELSDRYSNDSRPPGVEPESRTPNPDSISKNRTARRAETGATAGRS